MLLSSSDSRFPVIHKKGSGFLLGVSISKECPHVQKDVVWSLDFWVWEKVEKREGGYPSSL